MILMRESLILLAIGLLDLMFTLHLMAGQKATEGNPLMAYYLQFGVGAFVIVKLILLFLPIFVAEWSKNYRPRFVKLMLRGAIVTYVGAYIIGFLVVNIRPIATARDYIPAGEVRIARQAK